MKKIPIIIPSYEPDERLLTLLKELNDLNIGPVILVNDGSHSSYDEIFISAKNLILKNGGVLLVHKTNRGKGRALKTAFSYVLDNLSCIGVVTADSDGQHSVQSINAISDGLKRNENKLILGVRKFDSEGIPWKSRFGNTMTEKVFHYISGIHISDTQTGLRGIPITFMKELLDVKGERFEFEMRMLLECADKYEIYEIPIETIYDSETSHQTHFNPIKDSIVIYKTLADKFFKYILTSFSSSIIDLIAFFILCSVLKNKQPLLYIAMSTFIARIISGTYNYAMNYKLVFKSSVSVVKSSLEYITLALVQMLLSALFVTFGCRLFSFLPEVAIKFIVDIFLFFISYNIQQQYIFK